MKLFGRLRIINFSTWLKVAKFDIKLVILIFSLLVLVTSSIVLGFRGKHANEPVELGVSFSVKYARQLGNDWKTNFLALTDEVGVKHMRLMSYWDEHEPIDDQYDFADLDWQMDQADRHGVKVTLAIGQRQPRWPECHIPQWAESLGGRAYQSKLLDYISAVVIRYKDNPAIESYQLENEAANRLFGECPPYDPEFLEEEKELVKNLDPNKTLVINTSNQSGIPLFNGVGDSIGFSVYRHANFEALGRYWKWNFSYVPAWWHSFRAGLAEGFHQSEAFIHELQTEPWGYVETDLLTKQEQDELMDSRELVKTVEFAKSTGMKKMYLWGGEWWYYRKTQFNDKELWQTVKELYQAYD